MSAHGDDLVSRLATFCEIPGPAGREELVAAHLTRRWGTRLSPEIDRRGNFIGRVGGSGPRLAVVVHMDEIGWVVRHITEDGFLLVDMAQGSRRDPPEIRHMVGHPVVVLGRAGVVAEGLLAAPSGHVMTRAQIERGPGADYFVDLGLRSRSEAEGAGVHVGSPVAFATRTRQVGGRLVGKAMDDRMSLCVVDLLLERLDMTALRCELTVVGTVHEEGGLHGAYAVAQALDVDLAIVLEIGLVGDTPFVAAGEYDTVLGAGPILVHKDGQMFYDHELTWALADEAAVLGLPWQHGVFGNATTDGIPFQRAGIPTAVVGIPTRYTHTAFEMIDPDDVLATVDLLAAAVRSDAVAAVSAA